MEPACSGDHIKILFVDDDGDDRMLFQHALEEIAPLYRLITAANGVEALKVLRSGDGSLPYVMFMDINMPQMNGRELLAELVRYPEFRRMPVVVCSTSTSKDDQRYMGSLGAHSYLIKPVSYRQLCADLEQKLRALELWHAVKS